MKITINPTLDMETLRWVSNDGTYEHDGPLALFQGPSANAKANSNAQTAFYKQMTQEQATTFSEDQALYGDVLQQTLPILAKGPQQFGYSDQLDQMLTSFIRSSGDKATANAVDATELAAKQTRGGSPAPAGADEEVRAVAETLGTQSTNTNLINEKLSGFQAGNQQYTQALNALQGEQSQLDPSKYATATSGAGTSATGAINLADSERSKLLESVLGGVAQGALGVATGGASLAATNFINNSSSQFGA
jgi:hypothetical protein